MNILFICKYNRFRSRIAELYFKKACKIKGINVKSAGIIPGSYPLDKEEVRIAKKFGLDLKGRPKGLSVDLLRWAPLRIIVADNVPPSIIRSNNPSTKLIVWKIKDIKTEESSESIKRKIMQIIKKVDLLIKQLEKQKN